MKRIFVYAFALLPASLAAQSGKYVFKAYIGTATGSPAIAYLGRTMNGTIVYDSAVPRKGYFEFSGQLEHPEKANLLIKHWSSVARPASYSDKIPVYLEKGVITMKSADSLANASFTGSPLNAANREMKTMLQTVEEKRRKLMGDYYALPEAQRKDSAQLARTRAASDVLDEEQKALLKKYIQSHPNTLISLFALKTFAGAIPDYNEVNPLFMGLSAAVRSSYDGKLYAAQLDKVKNTSIGATAPQFTQNDVNGSPVSLASFRGKYVLIDFWASWCGPCRAENPNVVKAYHQYKDKGFTVLGVSLDQPNAHDKWVKAIADDHLEWTQVSDLQFWKNAAAQLYGVNAIPQNFLVGPDGKIVGKNLRGAALEKKLEELFPAKASAQPAAHDTTGAAALKAAVDANPASDEAHQQYIRAMGIDNPALVPQYEKWMQQHPKLAAIPYALGKAYCNHELPEAKPYLLKAVAINDTLAEAWQQLSIDAERWGDQKGAAAYMGKAAASAPDNPNYAFYYAMYFENDDPAKWRAMIQELAKRFPHHERGAQGLYWVATRSNDTAEKIKIYEQLRSAYAPAKFNWSSSGMSGLYEVYLAKAPEKALALAKEMGKEGGWPAQVTLAENIIQVQALMAKRQWKEAETRLSSIKAPRYSSANEMIVLLKAQVMDASGHTAAAYDSLALFCVKTPGDELNAALAGYGAKLGKIPAQVMADVWKRRDAAAKPAPPFSLGLYTSDGKANLSDYRGKVVLLTFWFPGCGPCRGEFPHFQTVMDRFKGKEVAYLGINVFPEQDNYVVPFMKGTRYSFTPLRGNSDWARDAYKVRGEPENFLIDQDGNIVFTGFRAGDPHTERMLELMINETLSRKTQTTL